MCTYTSKSRGHGPSALNPQNYQILLPLLLPVEAVFPLWAHTQKTRARACVCVCVCACIQNDGGAKKYGNRHRSGGWVLSEELCGVPYLLVHEVWFHARSEQVLSVSFLCIHVLFLWIFRNRHDCLHGILSDEVFVGANAMHGGLIPSRYRRLPMCRVWVLERLRLWKKFWSRYCTDKLCVRLSRSCLNPDSPTDSVHATRRVKIEPDFLESTFGGLRGSLLSFSFLQEILRISESNFCRPHALAGSLGRLFVIFDLLTKFRCVPAVKENLDVHHETDSRLKIQCRSRSWQQDSLLGGILLLGCVDEKAIFLKLEQNSDVQWNQFKKLLGTQQLQRQLDYRQIHQPLWLLRSLVLSWNEVVNAFVLHFCQKVLRSQILPVHLTNIQSLWRRL